MTDLHAAKAALSSLLSAGIWVPIVTALPEHTPLVAFSGFCGGIARWIALREHWWPDGLGSIVAGVTTAVFLSPLGAPILEPLTGKLEMDPTAAIMFGGFVTGLMGVSLLGWVLDIIRAKRKGVDDAQSDD